MITVNTGDIWKRFVSGDHSVFRNLFKIYYRGLFGYGIKLCFDSHLVEDCIQNLFVSLWERRDDLTHIESPNVYLYVSLRRNILKAKNRHIKEEDVLLTEKERLDIEFTAEELIIKNEMKKESRHELAKALNQLSNQQKEVIYLHYFHGMSYGEIEEILSINRQSVRNHMFRAMQTLRTVLDLDIMRLVISLVTGFLLFLA